MRPVNLIPEDQRRGPSAGAAARSRTFSSALWSRLLAGVTLLVTTSNQISSEKAEAVELEAKNAAAEAQVSKLAAYTQLRRSPRTSGSPR